MRKKRLALFVLLILSGICGRGYADLSTLIEVARGQAEIQKHYQKEDENYARAKKALDNGTLKKGISKAAVEKACGEPVITLQDKDKKMEKWAYKPAKESFFGGEQLSLFFDDNGVLAETEFRKAEPQTEE